jgi:hypothetical protein
MLTRTQEIFNLLKEKHLFNEIRKDILQEILGPMSTVGRWKEFLGSFVVEPRQTGKTSALQAYTQWLKEQNPKELVVVVVPYKVLKDIWGKSDLDCLVKLQSELLLNPPIEPYHLVMDEYNHLSLDLLLNQGNLLSVTGITT